MLHFSLNDPYRSRNSWNGRRGFSTSRWPADTTARAQAPALFAGRLSAVPVDRRATSLPSGETGRSRFCRQPCQRWSDVRASRRRMHRTSGRRRASDGPDDGWGGARLIRSLKARLPRWIFSHWVAALALEGRELGPSEVVCRQESGGTVPEARVLALGRADLRPPSSPPRVGQPGAPGQQRRLVTSLVHP